MCSRPAVSRCKDCLEVHGVHIRESLQRSEYKTSTILPKTVIFKMQEALLPVASVAVYSMAVVPIGKSKLDGVLVTVTGTPELSSKTGSVHEKFLNPEGNWLMKKTGGDLHSNTFGFSSSKNNRFKKAEQRYFAGSAKSKILHLLL